MERRTPRRFISAPPAGGTRGHGLGGHWQRAGVRCNDLGVSEVGVTVPIRDAATLEDLGVCHAPGPVEPGDLLAFEYESPLRVTTVLWVPPGSSVVPVLARPAPVAVAAR
jgi:hypothetical protein